MAFHYRTRGIILKKHDRGEANRVFKVFSEEYGKLSLWAVSERKITSKLRSGLELFSLSQLSFVQGKNKKVLVEALPLRQRLSLTRDLPRFELASRAAHLLDQHIAEEERDEKVWSLISEFFSVLEEEALPEKAYQSFAPQFLSLAGYAAKAVL